MIRLLLIGALGFALGAAVVYGGFDHLFGSLGTHLSVTVLAFALGIVIAEFGIVLQAYLFDNRPARLVIIGASKMADVGTPFLFTVVAKNAAGRVVPDTGITVAADNPDFTVSVGDDGSAGSVTSAKEGAGNLIASDAVGLKSAAFTVSFADNKPATIEIVAT